MATKKKTSARSRVPAGTRRSVRKLQKVSAVTITVSLPITLVRKLKWREGQRVVVTQSGNKLVVEDFKI